MGYTNEVNGRPRIRGLALLALRPLTAAVSRDHAALNWA